MYKIELAMLWIPLAKLMSMNGYSAMLKMPEAEPHMLMSRVDVEVAILRTSTIILIKSMVRPLPGS